MRACVLSLPECYHSDVIRIFSKSTFRRLHKYSPPLSKLNLSTILLGVQALNDITFVTLCDSFEEVNCIAYNNAVLLN